MEIKKVYVEENLMVEGAREDFRGGGIYKVEPHVYEQLVATGQAHEVNFPKLEALENSLSTIVAEHKKKKEALKTSPRYRTNEAEREYQLEQLELKLDEDIARAKTEYTKELELLEREIAVKAVQEVYVINEEVQRWLDTELAHLTFANGDEQVKGLTLMLAKASALNEEQLATVLYNAPKIKSAINGNKKAEPLLEQIVTLENVAIKLVHLTYS